MEKLAPREAATAFTCSAGAACACEPITTRPKSASSALRAAVPGMAARHGPQLTPQKSTTTTLPLRSSAVTTGPEMWVPRRIPAVVTFRLNFGPPSSFAFGSTLAFGSVFLSGCRAAVSGRAARSAASAAANVRGRMVDLARRTVERSRRSVHN